MKMLFSSFQVPESTYREIIMDSGEIINIRNTDKLKVKLSVTEVEKRQGRE